MTRQYRRLGIGVLPTDTLYGLVGSALSRETVEAIYRLRRRTPTKPMIVLIGSLDDLARFGIRPSPKIKKILKNVWPGKVSVVLPLLAPRGQNKKRGEIYFTKFDYLHRGTGTIAFRLPEPKWLRELLEKTGPLVAPSANHEGKPPAKTIREARKYFGAEVDFYIDAGKRESKPSTLIKIEHGKILVLRKGAIVIV